MYSVSPPALPPALSAVPIASRYAEQVAEICSFLGARTKDEYSIRKGEAASQQTGRERMKLLVQRTAAIKEQS